ncbi:efflux RND transporter periplasmic adaptor subunit [Roseobacter ponti]|uniref:Efflux RND transporter periplasmic adaptor subunit n=1 Tax=Roseobacter ponti TaxID=1891787 RepID=A0A858SWB4_9RHOB|nr:efflux RND transporter periplasmic adaptor subunit [Roseobacter ponti]QJF51156.1 efflux RND transporter periplasmic adaptor subunit [Roseobacter ponti]
MKILFCTVFCLVWSVAASAQESVELVPRPARVMTVAESPQRVERRYPAIVLSSQEAVLSFKVSGEVIELPVRAADNVKAGDVIARIDPEPFEEAVAQLESQIDQAVAQLRELRTGARDEEVSALEANVAAAKAQLDQAAEQLERTRELESRGVVSKARLDQDRAAADVAAAGYQAAVEQLAIGVAGGREEDIAGQEAIIRGLESQARTARTNLSDTTLRAPFNGVIARRNIDNFTNVSAGSQVVLLQALAKVDLAFDVPGPDVLIWSSGEEVRSHVLLEARPGALIEAELVEFSTQADIGTQTYRARVSIDVPEGAQVLPGMVGTVVVSTRQAVPDAITVPLSAVTASGDGAAFVWIVDPDSNTVTARPVSTGDITGEEVVVRDGLTAGDRIVTAGVTFLREGAVIRPVTQIGN